MYFKNHLTRGNMKEVFACGCQQVTQGSYEIIIILVIDNIYY